MNLRTPSFQAPQSHTHCSMIAAAFLDKCRTKVSEQLLVKACYDQTPATNTTAQAPLRSTLASTMTMEGSCARTSWLITSLSYASARSMLVQSFEGNPQARHATSAKPPHLLPGNEIPMKLLMTALASPTWIPASPKATLNASTLPTQSNKFIYANIDSVLGWLWLVLVQLVLESTEMRIHNLRPRIELVPGQQNYADPRWIASPLR